MVNHCVDTRRLTHIASLRHRENSSSPILMPFKFAIGRRRAERAEYRARPGDVINAKQQQQKEIESLSREIEEQKASAIHGD